MRDTKIKQAHRDVLRTSVAVPSSLESAFRRRRERKIRISLRVAAWMKSSTTCFEGGISFDLENEAEKVRTLFREGDPEHASRASIDTSLGVHSSELRTGSRISLAWLDGVERGRLRQGISTNKNIQRKRENQRHKYIHLPRDEHLMRCTIRHGKETGKPFQNR